MPCCSVWSMGSELLMVWCEMGRRGTKQKKCLNTCPLVAMTKQFVHQLHLPIGATIMYRQQERLAE